MAVFETLFILAGILVGLTSRGGMYLFLLPLAVVAFVLAIMNRPSPTGSKAKKIASSFLSAAYLIAVIVCPLTFFKNDFKESEKAPKTEPTVALQALDDLERIKAEIALHDDELIECDPTKMKGCLQFTNYGTERDSNRFYTVSLHWVLPRFQVYPKRVHRKIIKGLLGEELTDADTFLDSEHLGEIHKRALYRQAEEYMRNIESELRNYPNDWYYDSAHTQVAATLHYERQDSIDVAFDSLLWTTYYISNAGYEAGAIIFRTPGTKPVPLEDTFTSIIGPSRRKTGRWLIPLFSIQMKRSQLYRFFANMRKNTMPGLMPSAWISSWSLLF